MKYNVTLVDPPQYKWAYFLTDTCRLIAAGLRELGHSADLTVNHIDGSAMNVIVGAHLLSDVDARAIVQSGADYIAFHSEWLRLDEANHPISSFLGDRFEATVGDLLRGAVRVWDSVESNMSIVESMGVERSKLKVFWPGYVGELVDVTHRSPGDKDIDALFFGSVSPYRGELLSRLGESMRVHTLFDAPWAFRNDMIARAKLNVVVAGAPEYAYVPAFRTGYLLNNCCAVVVEAERPEPRYCNLVDMVPRDEFVEHCRELLSSGNAEQLAEESFQRYQQQPFAAVLEGLLD